MDPRDAFSATHLTVALWPHQQHALAKLPDASGDQGTYLVVPPGGGKTLIGLEAARRLARPTVVLCPNTAIQAQWLAQWRACFAPVAIEPTASCELPTPLTVLTYQSLCTIDTTAETSDPLDLLHPNGRALVERLSAAGPLTLILDECHHLLELWGRLLNTVVGRLDHPHVIGLTATPPHLMTADQAQLHKALFGTVDLEVSAPALVRDGHLAPYQKLAFFTSPTPAEADYIRDEATRFAELRTDLLAPDFGTTTFLDWLQARIIERRWGQAQVSWQRFERDEPALAQAALRLHTAGLLPLPEGATIREQHRHPPTADDWVALIGDYARRCLLASGDPRDAKAYEAIKRALPSVGYQLTRAAARTGVRGGIAGRPGAGPLGEQGTGSRRDPARRVRRAWRPAPRPCPVRLRGSHRHPVRAPVRDPGKGRRRCPARTANPAEHRTRAGPGADDRPDGGGRPGNRQAPR